MDDEQQDDDQRASQSRRTFMLFGKDMSPADMAAAINAEVQRQRELKDDRPESGEAEDHRA
jgi:hypothetical protein